MNLYPLIIHAVHEIGSVAVCPSSNLKKIKYNTINVIMMILKTMYNVLASLKTYSYSNIVVDLPFPKSNIKSCYY